MDGGDPAVVTGAIVAAVIALAVIAFFARNAAINARRRTQGARRLSGAQIRDVYAAGGRAGAATDEEVEQASELRRQIEWERAEYGRELAKHGRSQTRFWCAQHERHCRGSQGPHPPGGTDFVPAPPGWLPAGEGPPLAGV